MLFIMTSPDAVAPGGIPNRELVQVLIEIKAKGNPVALISNHNEPGWFQNAFSGSGVQFMRSPGRQNGEIISQNAAQFSLNHHDVLVLAAKPEDVQMAKNGRAVLIAAGWSNDLQVQGVGVRINNATELQEVINLTAGWGGKWWAAGNGPQYKIRALANLSELGVSNDQQAFASKLKAIVKNGGARLNALLAVTVRSLLMDGFGSELKLVWGVYPSSSSGNDDREILSDFSHRLRTTISLSRFCRKGLPLFIRHTASPKRSASGGGDRTDPSGQIETIHLNPFYEENNRLIGKHVIVLDDCTTHGVSFGVAAAFLRKAGAASITGISLGKFGNVLRYYDINITTNPFSAVGPNDYSIASKPIFPITTSTATQSALQVLFP